MVEDDRFLYLISPESVTTPEALDAFAPKLEEALATDQVAAFQLRLKGVSDDWIATAVRRLLPLCRARDVAFILNDRPDLAVALDCDGAHVSADEDMPIAKAREILGEDRILGATCRDSRHMAFEAGEDGADYVAFGAFFPSTSKAAKSRVTPDMLEWWSEIAVLPSVAIGGITAENCGPIYKAGADYICVISAVWDHPAGPAAGVQALVDACQAA
ncbi:MAG: thiamine phosphate synthase [Alphaproteobacteria bacterium]|nr:thiamine phosphate synthase [Alphaproteobacteria bacterium]MCB9931595.1 thiamine phosphate synthase [Alphaproteobacteria bacterium]